MDGRGAEGIHDLIEPGQTPEGEDFGRTGMTLRSNSPLLLDPGFGRERLHSRLTQNIAERNATRRVGPKC